MRFFSKSLVLLLGCLLATTACREEEPNVVRQDLREFSSEQEVTIGHRLVDQIRSDDHNFPVFYSSDPTIQREVEDYLNSLIQTAAITAPVQRRNDYDWKVTLIEDDETIHAFAAPGGHLFVYTGLLKSLGSEAELFSIMAHEIKYMDEGKPIDRLEDEFGGPTMGDLELGHDVTQIGNMTIWLRDIEYSEEDVLTADAYAIDIICPFKYESTALYDAISRLSSIENQEVLWLEKRPLPVNRLAKLEAMDLNCGLNEDGFEGRFHKMVEKL